MTAWKYVHIAETGFDAVVGWWHDEVIKCLSRHNGILLSSMFHAVRKFRNIYSNNCTTVRHKIIHKFT